MTISLTLFGTTACHLCEECLQLTRPLEGNGVVVRQVDITEDPALMAQYELRIPVLRRDDTGAELDWPFGLGELLEWLADRLREEA
ncbi:MULTISPECIES: glutaredoxin family protein [Halopseudomonas]|jgi:hypothetical protein|uniref:Glutaredoxin family protein n=1 Tax=Halopseudomonas formosensis TaxID=1002526 RepID=A0A1I6AKT4_9GAMM|nr:glutaredoxin family protein [Halopseudomonas formosensis]MDX9687494.1 glutaredoxin family protein [Halopseudomonas formosensis]MDY3199243.1 glutaredoxin family protein [Pseudomonadaceae bacterium]NLC01962.1 glutaredoxin family protein [Halopseudomonas formosensis]SFQ69274.1 Glutaredoxin-like domain [Halopseudomonas formosensis]